jgi:hypothetical protein
MYTVVVKFNNGSSANFSYTDQKITMRALTSDIGRQQYPDKYNPKIDQYIKLIHMGKITDINDEVTFDPTKPEQTFHCVIKKIPEDAFVVEKSKTMEPHEVNELVSNPKFIELITQRVVFEYLTSILDTPDKMIDVISGKTAVPSLTQDHLIAKYTHQIQVLKDMGFTDENELAVLLSNSNGNLENVINLLMT